MKRKKAILYILIICFIFLSVFIISIDQILNKYFKKQDNITEEKVKNIEEKIDFVLGSTIRVKNVATEEIVAMDINEYLSGVLPSEMPPYYEMEALKAQAIIARTFTYKKIQESRNTRDYDITDTHKIDQAYITKEKLFRVWEQRGYDENKRTEYWNKVLLAIKETENIIVTYEGNYINAYFHASSPEKTESVSEIWGKKHYPYLVSVENKEDETYENRTSRLEIKNEEFKDKIAANVDKNLNLDYLRTKEFVKIKEYTVSGRVNTIEVGNTVVSAEKLRTIFGLKSTNFKLSFTDSSIIFDVIGYGHGVGMSQVGANYLAKQGKGAEDIIKYYYLGVNVMKING